MTSPADTAQSIRAALEPFVRPREEAAHIRRVLKAHLAASLKSDDDVLDGSLALVDIAWDTAPLPEARGLQRNYLRALQANLEARRAFEQRAAATAATAEIGATASSTGDERASSSILQDHLATVRLTRKRDRLQVVSRYLDALGERPVAVAAGEDYLHPEFIYGDATRTLPSVPKAVVDGLAEEEDEKVAAAAGGVKAEDGTGTSTTAKAAADLEGLVAQLEKSVLRAQLGLRQEEKRLAAAKTRAARRQGAEDATATMAAKRQALGVARDELIAWMETELGNAANEEKGDEDEDEKDHEDEAAAESSRLLRQSLLNGHGGDPGQRKAKLEEKLAAIRNKYALYVEARRALVNTVGTMSTGEQASATKTAAQNPLFANMPQLLPQADKAERSERPGETTPKAAAETSTDVSSANPEKAVALGHLLLTPYLERLLAVAHDQKADIAHKAHYNVLLAKRLKDTCQMLNHLADESQLLPRHTRGAGGAGGGGAALLRKKDVLATAPGRDGGPDGSSQRVAAWTYAADSAKIATFEAVFEQVEEGQVALEAATKALAEADIVLGRKPVEGEKGGTKHKSTDIWAALNGELGLLQAEDRRP